MSKGKAEEKTISIAARKAVWLARAYPQFEEIVKKLVDLPDKDAIFLMDGFIIDIDRVEEHLGIKKVEHEEVEDVTADRAPEGVKPLFAVFYNK